MAFATVRFPLSDTKAALLLGVAVDAIRRRLPAQKRNSQLLGKLADGQPGWLPSSAPGSHAATTLCAFHYLVCSLSIWATQSMGGVKRVTLPLRGKLNACGIHSTALQQCAKQC